MLAAHHRRLFARRWYRCLLLYALLTSTTSVASFLLRQAGCQMAANQWEIDAMSKLSLSCLRFGFADGENGRRRRESVACR